MIGERSWGDGLQRRHRRQDAIRAWSEAIERHDSVEVARVVRQVRNERLAVAASGALGPMVGGFDTSSVHGSRA